jgi:hypothetical protein
MFEFSSSGELGGVLGKAIDISSSHAYTVLVGDLGYLLRFTVGSTADGIVTLPTTNIATDAIVAIRKSDSGTKRVKIRQGSTDVAWLNESQVTVVLRWNGANWLEFEPPRSRPPYFSGRRYKLGPFTQTNVLVATLETVMYMTVWFCERDVTISAFGFHNASAATAGGKCKMAVWANEASTFNPTGLPLIGSNTDLTTTTNNQDREVSVSYTFLRGSMYWFGYAFSTAAPQPVCLNINNTEMEDLFGRPSGTLSNTTICGWTVPFTYANDITTLDLTSSTLTPQVVAVGAPVPQILTP